MKSRIVIDTSTLIGAAIRPDSTPRRALRVALELYDLCLSRSILAELETVLGRPNLLRYASTSVYREFLNSLLAEARLYTLSDALILGVSPSCRDSKDNHVVALAQIAHVDCILSSDKDLLTLHPWRGIPIYAPAFFLDQVEGRTTP